MENVFEGITEKGKRYSIHFDDDHYSLNDLFEIMRESQAEFAQHIGMSLSTLKLKLAGAKLTWKEVVRICKYCNINPSKLYPPEF